MPHRFATLLVALAAASTASAQLPARKAPAAEEAPTTIDAERIDGVGEFEFGAGGSAEIQQDDLTIFGERLRYNPELGRVEGDGGVRLQIGVDRFFGPRLRYDTLGDVGVFEQPRFLLYGDLTARGSGEELQFLGPDRYRIRDATFTTCPAGKEDWRLEAAQLDLDYVEFRGRAESPRLKFFDTTILAAPFATFPLERRRKSGILAPHFGNSTQRGFELGVPYYWNIAPEYDATITPVYMTKRGLMLKNQFRYLNRRFLGDSQLEVIPDDTQSKTSRYGLSLRHSHQLGAGLSASVDYNRVSDDRYFVDYASEVRQSSIGNLPQDAFLTQGASVGRMTYVAQARLQRFQTLQDPREPIISPYHRMPQLSFTGDLNDIGGLFDTVWPAEFVRFEHSTLVDGNRFTINPSVAAPILAPGWFFTPKAGLWHASYQLSDRAAGLPQSPNVAVPWLSADTGLIFERDAHWFGRDLLQTLEPRLFYVYVPFRRQDQIPIFDTALAEFNFPQLFTENRFTGGDRFGDTNQVTAALTTRFMGEAGREVFRATIGQRYHFSDERVTLNATTPPRTRNSSDILASVGGRLLRDVVFDASTQYNRQEKQAQRYSVAARYAPVPGKVLSASYRFNREELRQVDISAQWPLAVGWFGVARYNYSLLDRRLVDGLAGIEYNAGCWVFRGVFQRIQASAQVASTSLFFQLEFNGIGQVGTTQVVNLLKRNVAGYSVSNPRDLEMIPEEARPRLPFEMVY